MKLATMIAAGAGLVIPACMAVREADLRSWQGRPVAELEKHPVFLTMPVVRTVTSDGTEIRNYVAARNAGKCSPDGSIFSSNVTHDAYNQFISCMQAYATCQNIFAIKAGVIERYTPIGTGGAGCY